jgi:predicted ATPase
VPRARVERRARRSTNEWNWAPFSWLGAGTLAGSFQLVWSLALRSDSFVGRSHELAELRARLLGGARLITIVGTAGVGKTRLACELVAGRAAEWEAQGYEALLACDLVEVRDVATMCSAMARVIELLMTSEANDLAGVIGRALSARGRALLVLDNFEQLASDAGRVVSRWLEEAPELQVVVTSRAPLQTAAEHVFSLAPLALGDAELPDAAHLFLERAAAARPGLTIDDRTRAAACEVALRLDGIPLALELAAARANLLSAEQILVRIDRSLALLTNRAQGAPAKAATMRDAIAWSWGLLDDAERLTLAQSSVFHGGFSVEAAEAVLTTSPGTTVVDALQALHDKSLLRVHSAAAIPSESRFSLYVCIRELAAERLAEMGGAAETRARRDDYFLRVGRAWAQRVRTHDGAESLRRLDLEQDNLLQIARDALASDPTRDSADRALGALLTLEPNLGRRATASFGAMLDEALAYATRAVPPVDPALFRRARLAFAHTLWITTDRARAVAIGEEVLADAEAAMDIEIVAEALGHLAECSIYGGGTRMAPGLLMRGLALCAEAGLEGLETRLRSVLGVALVNLGKHEEALRELRRARAVANELGDQRTAALCSRSIGHMHSERGALRDARAQLEEALGAARAIGDRWIENACLSDLGYVLAQEGRFEEAARCYDEVLPLHRRIGYRRGEAIVRAASGLMMQWLDRAEEAEHLMQSALSLVRAVGDERTRALVLGRLATLAADAGDLARACEHLAASRVLTEREGDPDRHVILAVHEGHLELARCRAALAARDHAAALSHRREAERRVALAAAPVGEREPIVRRSDDARLAVALLERALARAEAPSDGLVVAVDAVRFRTREGDVGDLARRDVLRRVLAALVRARLDRPGAPVSSAHLLAAGWPEARVSAKVARNRLYVALSTLRSMGLKGVLTSTPRGWLLDPATPLIVVPARDV